MENVKENNTMVEVMENAPVVEMGETKVVEGLQVVDNWNGKTVIEKTEPYFIKLLNGCEFLTSLPDKTFSDRKKLFRVSALDIEGIGDNVTLSKPLEFNLKDIYLEPVHVNSTTDDNEVYKMIRLVVVDDKGNAYQTCSLGVISLMKKLISIMGLPSEWDEPIKIIFKKEELDKTRKMLTFDLAD